MPKALHPYSSYSAVDGGFSKFGDWSKCSAECGGGAQTRSRTCTNPAPANGGADCKGDSSETRKCNIQACPGKVLMRSTKKTEKHGTATPLKLCCFSKIKSYKRHADDLYLLKSISPFSVDGGFSKFGDWSECSAKCGGGTQRRSRTCTNPAPANGGADCKGNSFETRKCNTQACPGYLYIIEIRKSFSKSDPFAVTFLAFKWR